MAEADPLLDSLRSSGEVGLADALNSVRERLHRIINLRMDQRVAGRIDPSDILQETFLQARNRLERYLENPGVPVFVWLRGMTIEILLQAHRRHLQTRKRDAGHEVSLESIKANASSAAALARCLVDGDATPASLMQQRERSLLIETAIEALEEEDREVLTLRHFERLSNDEVAQIIGVKKSAASRRYTRALLRLRERLNDVPGLEW